jgi:hypothetical protein
VLQARYPSDITWGHVGSRGGSGVMDGTEEHTDQKSSVEATQPIGAKVT